MKPTAWHNTDTNEYFLNENHIPSKYTNLVELFSSEYLHLEKGIGTVTFHSWYDKAVGAFYRNGNEIPLNAWQRNSIACLVIKD